MSIGMNRKTVVSFAVVLMCAAGVGLAQPKPAPPAPAQTKLGTAAKGLHFEPQLTEVDAPGRMEAWDEAGRSA
jgi:hypothetical protein